MVTCWGSFQTAYTIPILAFAFVCHPEVLPIYTELRKYVPSTPGVWGAARTDAILDCAWLIIT